MTYGGVFDHEQLAKEIAELEKETLEAGFWNDKKHTEEVFSKLNDLKDTLMPWKDLISDIDNVDEIL
ncbi:MAG: peptide chain release factor 2, partial [Sphaerochaetaceae bacterium]|nr:peptide chain release factor 2 [Sphaerochaetaceae bacterium]